MPKYFTPSARMALKLAQQAKRQEKFKVGQTLPDVAANKGAAQTLLEEHKALADRYHAEGLERREANDGEAVLRKLDAFSKHSNAMAAAKEAIRAGSLVSLLKAQKASDAAHRLTQTGPHGGQFYITATGQKVYVGSKK